MVSLGLTCVDPGIIISIAGEQRRRPRDCALRNESGAYVSYCPERAIVPLNLHMKRRTSASERVGKFIFKKRKGKMSQKAREKGTGRKLRRDSRGNRRWLHFIVSICQPNFNRTPYLNSQIPMEQHFKSKEYVKNYRGTRPKSSELLEFCVV